MPSVSLPQSCNPRTTLTVVSRDRDACASRRVRRTAARRALVGGVMLAVIGWYGPLACEEAHEPGHCIGIPDVQVSSTVQDAPPWLFRRDVGPDESPAVDLTSFPARLDGEVTIEMRVLLPGGKGLPFDATGLAILTPEQREQLLARFDDASDFGRLTTEEQEETLARFDGTSDLAFLAGPQVVLPSGVRASLRTGTERTYLAGYRQGDADLEPVVQVLKAGLQAEITMLVEAGGTRIVEARARRTAPTDLIERTAHVTMNEGEGDDYPWIEPIVRRSQTIPLPAAGMLIPPGASLLLPATGRIECIRPSGITATPDPRFRTWWLLITPASSQDPLLKSALERLRVHQEEAAQIPLDERLPSEPDPRQSPIPGGANGF